MPVGYYIFWVFTNGIIYNMDWIGLDWTGLTDQTGGPDSRTGLADWTTGLDYRTGLADCELDSLILY